MEPLPFEGAHSSQELEFTEAGLVQPPPSADRQPPRVFPHTDHLRKLPRHTRHRLKHLGNTWVERLRTCHFQLLHAFTL